MVMVLDTVGLPADSVALILAVDWLLDRLDLRYGHPWTYKINIA